MLKIRHLDRALRYVDRFGNPSDEGKPISHGERAARILDVQTKGKNLTDRAFSGLPTGNQTLPVMPEINSGIPLLGNPSISYEKATRGLDNLIRKTTTNVSTVSNQ